MEYDKDSFRKLLEETVDTKNKKLYKDNNKLIWEMVIKYFNEFKFEKIILVTNEKVNTDFAKRKPGRFYGSDYVMFYKNPKTGAKYYTYEDLLKNEGTDIHVTTNHSWSSERASKYIPSLDVICIYTFDGAENDGNNYKVYDITILLRKSGNAKKDTYILEKSDGAFYLSRGYHWTISNDIVNSNSKKDFATAIYEMYGTSVFNTTANNYETIRTHYPDFLNAKDTLEPKNKSLQAEINKLVKIDLPDAIDKNIKDSIKKSNNKSLISVTKISKVCKDVSVLRWMLYDPLIDKSFDGLRIYYKNDKFISCKRDNSGKFIQYPINKLNMNNFCSDEMCEIKKEDIEGTPFKYYFEIINNLDKKIKSFALLTFIKYPRIEQLAKLGFNKYLTYVFKKSEGHPFEEIVRELNADDSAKNINKFIGFNAYQINKMLEADEENIKKGTLTACFIKSEYFNQEDISNIDNETFDKVFNLISNSKINIINDYYFPDIIYIIRNVNQDLFKYFTNKVLEKLLEVASKDYSMISAYCDYINMVDNMEMFNQFKISFDTKQELENMHDIVSDLYNIKRTEIEVKTFKKNVKKMEKFEYSNQKLPFIVVAPKEADDIAREGIELHHCVKSYIPKIASGTTNVIFIRKKEEVDKPFFTVEISNKGNIEQVHGFGNRNADTEPGLTEFVEKWAKTKKLKINNINKIR